MKESFNKSGYLWVQPHFAVPSLKWVLTTHGLHKQKALCGWLGLLLFLALGALSASAKSDQLVQADIQGYVDSFVVDGNQFIAQGWAGSSKPNDKVASLSIWLADTLVYEGGFEQLDRPVVAEATVQNDWLKSGWRVSAALPDNIKAGKYSLKVLVKLEEGHVDKLSINNQINPIVIDEYMAVSKHMISIVKVVIIFMIILLCVVFYQADNLAKLFSNYQFNNKPPVIFGSVLFFSFLVLVSLGITGSSINFGLKKTPFVKSDSVNIWGKDQSIRSDEWIVSTPLAIAQYNHKPRYPVINTNLGEDGQNMLVVGGVGVPIAHISVLAKPATWGFFLFDLKRGLSWLWFFPAFAGLFAIWGVVALILPGRWQWSFLIAFLISVSPYMAVWSNMPAYALFFPCLGLLTAISILKEKCSYVRYGLGAILGLSLTGFVLILYPPWQVSLGCVFLAITIGIIVRDKLYRNFSKNRLAAYGLAIIVAGLILWEWWSDAHLAIQTMMATVYPGQRTTLLGGEITIPKLLRGFTNIVTIHKLASPNSNQSEIASFYYMLLPLATLFFLRAYQKVISGVEIALALSIIFILYYMMVGVPEVVAKFSLWGRVPGQRADIALGFSCMLLSGLLLASNVKSITNQIKIKALAFLVALIWAAVVIYSILRLDKSILTDFTPGLILGLFFVILASGYWLALAKCREFICLNLALSVATVLPFNPISIAPHNITSSSFINGYLGNTSEHLSNKRILVLESQIPTMYLLASGLPVANGIFYYPQHSIWERLDKVHTSTNVYNRYQHLIFTRGVVENIDNYRIELQPRSEVVKVIVNLAHFDFHKSGANLIVAPQNDEVELKQNEGLSHIKNEKGWSWFEVVERRVNDN